MNEPNPTPLQPVAVTALYLLRSLGSRPVAKIGIVRTPYEDLRTVLRRVRARVRAAVPGGKPLRMRDLPQTEVWVVLSPVPRLLREVETYLVARLGSPANDPLQLGRGEFIAPHHVEVAHALLDAWRAVVPGALTPMLYSSSGGFAYLAPQELLPSGARTGETVRLVVRAEQGIYLGRSLSGGENCPSAESTAWALLDVLVCELGRRQQLVDDLQEPVQAGPCILLT